jgi:hypothetical protein
LAESKENEGKLKIQSETVIHQCFHLVHSSHASERCLSEMEILRLETLKANRFNCFLKKLAEGKYQLGELFFSFMGFGVNKLKKSDVLGNFCIKSSSVLAQWYAHWRSTLPSTNTNTNVCFVQQRHKSMFVFIIRKITYLWSNVFLLESMMDAESVFADETTKKGPRRSHKKNCFTVEIFFELFLCFRLLSVFVGLCRAF